MGCDERDSDRLTPEGEKGHKMNGYPCEGCKKRDNNACLDKNCKPWRDWFRGEWRRTCEMVKELDRKVRTEDE